VRHSKSKQAYFATFIRWGRAAVWAARCDGRGDGLTCIVMVRRSLIGTIRIEAALLTLPVPCIRPRPKSLRGVFGTGVPGGVGEQEQEGVAVGVGVVQEGQGSGVDIGD
jgi:hypothetical protein